VVTGSNPVFAFSNQWGGEDWMQAMSGLRDAHPEKGITFTPVEGD